MFSSRFAPLASSNLFGFCFVLHHWSNMILFDFFSPPFCAIGLKPICSTFFFQSTPILLFRFVITSGSPAQFVGSFQPHRPSGQAAVTGVLPFSSPSLAFTFVAPRAQYSYFSPLYARSPICTEFCHASRTFSHFRHRSMCKKESLAGLEPTISTSIVARLTIESPGTPASK